MGTWGTALYSDDLAADVRNDLRDLIGQGLSADEALESLCNEYSSTLADADEAPTFWLAFADTAWRLGRPQARATAEALRAIQSGAAVRRWEDAKDRLRRAAVLDEVESRLQTPAPPAKRVPRRFVAANSWTVGEVVAFQLASGSWTLFRVIGHHQDKGGRHAVCEALDWIGRERPDPTRLPQVPVCRPVGPWRFSQFLVGEPRRPKDIARFYRTGASSDPSQTPGGFAVFVFPHFDNSLRDIFGIE